METEPEGKGCCWQIFRCLIILLVLFNALIFALLGAGIATTGVLGIVFAQTRAVVPVYASGIIACIGIGLLLVSLFGLCAACKRSKYGPMFVFIPFLLLFCGIFSTITVYCFFTSDVLDTLEHHHALIESDDEGILQIDMKMRIDLEDLQSAGANFVKDGVIRLWDACSGEVTQTAGSEPVYELTCSGEGYDTLAYSVNRVCFDPDDNDFDSYMSVCYSDDDWFAPADPSLATTLEKLNTPKGFYCACADEIIDAVAKYDEIIKWTSMGLAIEFFICIIGCLILCCCCAKSQPLKKKTAKAASSVAPDDMGEIDARISA